MIHVNANYDSMRLRMHGHANAQRNEHDHDLVCCAASILLQTLVRSCGLCDGVTVSGTAGLGNADIQIKCEPERKDAAMGRYQMCLDGLDMLAKTYPQSLVITCS